MGNVQPKPEPKPAIAEVVNVPGREVSCRAFAHIFRALRRKRLGSEALTAGVPYPLEHLLDVNQRIDWESFRKLMANVGSVWSDPELIELGRRYARSRWTRPIRVLEKLGITSARIFRDETGSQPGLSNLVATCVRVLTREVEPNRFEVDVLMKEGYEPCREALVSTLGWIMEWPSAVGQGSAIVQMEEIEGGARYYVHIQPKKSLGVRLRNRIRSLLDADADTQAIRETLELLYTRRLELEKHHAEHLATERELRESEERFRALAEAASQGVMIHDRGIVLDVNEVGARMLGYEPSELIGKEALNFLAAPESRDLIQKRMGTGFEGIDEVRLLRKDGTTFAAEIEARDIVYRRRNARVVVARDITERKRTEEVLLLSEERYRSLAENAHDLIAEFDTKGHVVYASPSHLEVTGREPDELLGRTFLDTIHPDDLQSVGAELSKFLSERVLRTVTYRARHRDGHWIWIESSGRPFKTQSGEIRAVVVSRDITERKQAEAERRQLETQMRRVQKLENLGVVAGGIAHDFNNLLTPILGYAGRALSELDPDSSTHASIGKIQKTARRAAELTRELLTYAGEGRIATRAVDLSELIKEMEALLQAVNVTKATLRYDLATDLSAVSADPTQIRQVVMNLISNAVEAIGESSGVIGVRTGAMVANREYLDETYLGPEVSEGSYVYLEVSDTGCGMDEEEKAKIFDPFFTTKFTGRGLGLAVVLGIVRAHRGTLSVASSPGMGTTFRVLFPSASAVWEKEGAAAEEKSGWRGSGTVLVVDDEEEVRDVTRWMLESAGFSVLTAEDGESGVDLLRSHREQIIAVLLDLAMPRMGGEEALREMRRIRPDLRILLASGYGERDVTQRLTDKRFTGFIQKPYERTALTEHLRALLQS